MNRKKQIIELIKKHNGPISATALAKTLGVSRQIIVGDVALIRASGTNIIATPRGYVLDQPQNGIKKTIAVKHGSDLLEEELNLIVDQGGSIEDVIVEHPVYGEITGNLHIRTRYEVQEFIKKLAQSDAAPLSLLTDGVHLHTITCENEETLNRILEVLNEKHILMN